MRILKTTVRKKLYCGFSIVLLLFVIVAVTNTILQKMLLNISKEITYLQDAVATTNNYNYLLVTVDDTGAYYLLSYTQQDLDIYWKQEEQNVTDIQNVQKELRQRITDEESLKFLDASVAEFAKYLNSKHKAYLTYQASLVLGLDGKNLEKDLKGVQKAQDIYFNAVMDPVLENNNKLMDSLKKISSQKEAQMAQLQTLASSINIILTLIALIIGGLIAFFLSNSMAKSLKQLQDASIIIADGNLTEQVIVKSEDELGELAKSFNKMSLDLNNIIKEVIDTASSLGATSEELSASAEEATAASEQVSNTINQLATGATNQAKSVEETSAVINQLCASSQQVEANAENVSQSSGKAAQAAKLGVLQAENAVRKIEQIREVTAQTAEVVSLLGEQSKQIGQIVDVIQGIADQTNLLALNAAIEAARAGEQGRGFAVVAEEVRKLAEQSSISAQQIATLISNIQRETERAVHVMEKGKNEVDAGVEAVNSAGDAFQTIVSEINAVVEQMQQVSVATQQMASGTSQVVQSIDCIGLIAGQTAINTQEVSATSEEQAATMVSVSQSADALAKLGESLTRLVAKFKV